MLPRRLERRGGAYSGAVEVAPGVWVYQITKNGLALQLTLQGTKYYKDDDLNNKSYLLIANRRATKAVQCTCVLGATAALSVVTVPY